MHESQLVPVILCGGDGTRLWPLSRVSAPKPFLPLIGDQTLFQRTLDRLQSPLFSDAIVVTGSAHLELVERQLGDSSIREIIVEPEPKGTAAAIALAASRVARDSCLVVCPSDHHIEDAGRFADAVAKAARLAREGWLVCLGVEAKAAETRFGYIRRGEPLGPDGFQIREFVEKPAADVAAGFIASGQFAWNSGIFVFRAGNFLDELDRHHPEAAGALSKSVSAGRSADAHFFPDGPAFSAVQVESVDRAIMETTDRAALVMTETGWSDVGDWRTLYAERPKDSDGNSVRGPAELLDCRNMLVDTDGPRVHLIGLENVIVVIDGDDILIANAAQSEKVARLNGARRR